MQRLALVLLAAVLLPAFGCAEADLPTPQIRTFETLDVPEGVGWVLRGQLAESRSYVGLALVCKADRSGAFEVTVSFGSFPRSRQPVQLAVKDVGGNIERFGPVVKAGPESGFHSPQLEELEEAERFLKVALKPGSLVSNGYRSFWNRAGEAANREVLDAFLACARGAGRS